MLGLFKLQGKKTTMHNPVSYKTSWAGLKGRVGRGHPWAGGWVLGGLRERKKRAPEQKETGCPNGRDAKGASEEWNWWGGASASAFPTWAQCWRGHGATTCPPLALGEPVTQEPLSSLNNLSQKVRQWLWSSRLRKQILAHSFTSLHLNFFI